MNRAPEAPSAPRALLVYRADSFLMPPESPRFRLHQNRWRAVQLARLLGEFGYIVDVADLFDVGQRRFEPTRRYDVILSAHSADACFDSPLTRDARRLFLATTTARHIHNSNVLRRHQMLSQRRGSSVQQRRKYWEQLPFVESADAIIGVGNSAMLESWREVSRAKTYAFNNHGYDDTRFIFESKNFAAAKRNFFFFASASQVQKGLDLLLEIFPRHPDLHLYVCSGFSSEPDFCECYKKELFETPNVHPIGWIEVNGARFYELAETCAFSILPTCSEGQAGSIIQCMWAGLIPVLTREANLDAEDFGVLFADDSLDEIERVILELANLPEEWHRERSLAARKAAEEKYSEAEFLRRWREILGEVLPNGASTTAGGA